MQTKKFNLLIISLLLFGLLLATGICVIVQYHHIKPHKPPTLPPTSSPQPVDPLLPPVVPPLPLPPPPPPIIQPPTSLYPGNITSQSHNTNNFVNKIKFNVIVSATGDEDFVTISEAILSAPSYSSSRYYIRVSSGVYNETVVVPLNKTNVVLIGDGAEVTKITANRHHPNFSTSDSATFSVFGDGFIAQNITFENSAGAKGGQAVALLSNANHTIFYKCKFLGYQDTLYAKYGTQYYRECEIYGTVDFIFGSATAVFQKCNLYARAISTYQEVTYTAQGRQSLEEKSGFTMQGCNFTTDPFVNMQNLEYTMSAYLGRPWHPYSTVMVMESYLDKIISSSGWESWSNNNNTSGSQNNNNNNNDVIYIEFENWGPGANTSRRVRWSSSKSVDLAKEVILSYTASHLIQGDEWIPDTGVPYDGGFLSKS